MGKGSGMTGELIFLLAVGIAVFGIIRYNRAETNDYAAVLRAQNDAFARLNSLENALEKLEDFQHTIDEFSKTLVEFSNELDQSEDKTDKFKEELLSLQEKLAKKDSVLKIEGPIAVDVKSIPPPLHKMKSKLSPEEVAMIKKSRANAQQKAWDKEKPKFKKLKKQIKELSQ